MIVGSHAHRVDSNSARDQLRVGVVHQILMLRKCPLAQEIRCSLSKGWCRLELIILR